MKTYKTLLRIWIGAASILSFLIGWIFFAHSNKPAPLIQAQPAVVETVTEPQAASISEFQRPTFQPPAFQFQAPQGRLRLRTGGS